jgi:hypothetical protein
LLLGGYTGTPVVFDTFTEGEFLQQQWRVCDNIASLNGAAKMKFIGDVMRVRHLISAIVIVTLLTGAFFVMFDNDDRLSDVSDGAPLSGDGTQDNPYKINNESDLRELDNYLGVGYYNKYFVITQNISLSSNWTPIGAGATGTGNITLDMEKGFFGNLNGHGFTISNLTHTSTTGRAGLFEYIGGSVGNMKIVVGDSTNGLNGDSVGALAVVATGKVVTVEVTLNKNINGGSNGTFNAVSVVLWVSSAGPLSQIVLSRAAERSLESQNLRSEVLRVK